MLRDQCVPCGNGGVEYCDECHYTDDFVCDGCEDGYTLTNGSCTGCTLNDPNCSECQDSTCLECVEGYGVGVEGVCEDCSLIDS